MFVSSDAPALTRPLLVAALAVAALAAVSPPAAPAQATAPTTQESPLQSRIRVLFSQLTDPDAAVREQARWELMGLRRADLPVLRDVVSEIRPLLPAQAVVLRDIVTQVYLSGEPYASDRTIGFLGVRMLATGVRVAAEGDDAAEEPAVVIHERLPGFVGFRAMHEGDVILAVNGNPPIRIRQPNDLSAHIQQCAAGDKVEFAILRQGRTLTVKLTLDPYPQIGATEIKQFEIERDRAARDYWNENFAPLVDDGLS